MATTKLTSKTKIKPSKVKTRVPIKKKKMVAQVKVATLKPAPIKVASTKSTKTRSVLRKLVNKKTRPTKSKRKIAHPIVPQVSPLVWMVGTTLGLALVLIGIFFYLYSQTILSFKVSPMVVAPSHLRNAYPVNIAIDSVKIDVAVTPATIKDGIWQMSDSTATYLENSSRPAEGGNVIIYGHNKNHLFAPLHRIKVGDKIILTAASGTMYEYKVNEIKVVPPSAIEEVTPTDFEVLTVYTCTGLFDSQRLVVKAAPTRVESL